jgi:colicin import membrane protein
VTTTDLVPVNEDAQVAEVERQVAQARAQAEAVQVRDPAEANVAGELLKEIARRKKAAEAERKELVNPLNATVKRINQKFKDAAAPYDEADRIVREKVSIYQAEQDRIRKEEEDRLEAERVERERIANEAREKQEAEARAKREQAEKEEREAEEERQKAKNEADREAAEKLAAEAREKAQEAQTAEAAIASLPEVQLPKAVVEAAPKIDGISSRTKREVFVTDKSLLPETLPDGTPLVVVDMVALRGWMNKRWTETGQPPELPGAEFKKVPAGSAVRT